MDTKKQKIAFLIFFCLGNFLLMYAQPSLQTSIDKNAILIGEQVKLKVQASFQPDDYFVRWISIADSLPHFELVDKTAIDSIYIDQKLTGLAQTFTLTSFDSGNWEVPSFNIKFNPAKGDSALNFYSDPLPVSVAFQKDTTTTLRDIKALRELETAYTLWYWLAGCFALLLLILLVIWLYRRNKKAQQVKPARSSLSAYKNAMAELEQLKQINLSEPAAIKTYHTKLAVTLKQYLSAKKGMDYGSKTTGDILIFFKENNIDKGYLSKISAALRKSDVVKFAKYLPVQQESEESLQSIKLAIDITEQVNLHTKQ